MDSIAQSVAAEQPLASRNRLVLTVYTAAIFLSALAAASQQERELAVIATNDRQLARLALALRAAGLKPKDIEEQFLYIHPDVSLPEGFDALRTDRAMELLASSARKSAA